MVICQVTDLACCRKTALRRAECNSIWRCRDKQIRPNSLKLRSWNGTCYGLLWSHCFSVVPICGRTWPTYYVRLSEFGPRSVTTCARWRQSPTKCIFLLELKRKSLGNNFGNQSEQDTVSSPLLLLKRSILNRNRKDKSGYCACAVTAFQRNLNGIFFFYNVPKYIFTEQRLQSTGGGGRGGGGEKRH